MLPVLLDMTRDDCRRTLRRLELEAYSSMVSVFRAQGALEENRKKMLEDIRGALHISSDRHNAEARRVANDELLATIAEQLCGPNTNLGWVSEGRRRIPLMPRGIPQTVFTEIADEAAHAAAEENKSIKQKQMNQEINELLNLPIDMEIEPKLHRYPIVMEDQTMQILEAETPARKKFKSESEDLLDTPTVPNAMRINNQKHLNISQIYSSFSKKTTGKSGGPPKQSYNQSMKPNKPAILPKSPKTPKHRSHKQSNKMSQSFGSSKRDQMRDAAYLDSGGRTPSGSEKGSMTGFQATFTQSLKKHKSHKDHYADDLKLSNPVQDARALHLLSHTSCMLDESNLIHLPDNLDPSQYQSQDISQFQPTSPTINKIPQKSCHFIIKKKPEPIVETPLSPQKIQVSGIQMIQKPAEIGGVKVLQNCQVFVTPNSSNQKIVNAPAKIILSQTSPKLQTTVTPVTAPDSKIIIVSNAQTVATQSSTVQLSNVKNKTIILPTGVTIKTEPSDANAETNADLENMGNKAITVSTSDLKLPAKTLFLNSKGHKMVVVPKGRAKTSLIHPMPLLQVKGIQTRPTMKFVPVNSQSTPIKNTANIAIVSKSASMIASPSAHNKIVTVEATSTTKLNMDSPEIKFIKNTQTPLKSSSQTIVKPPGTKSNVIVVQKGMALNKGAITFTRNGSELSKIVMGNKMVNPVSIQSSSLIKNVTASPKMGISMPDTSKSSSNIIVLELSNEKMARAATVPESMENEATSTTIIPEEGQIVKPESGITVDTPVLFDEQITEETCNTNSVDSMTDSIMDMVEMDTVSDHEKAIKKETDFRSQNTSNNNDWDMELETADSKQKRNDLAMEMGISSDSETDAYLVKDKTPKKKPQESSSLPERELTVPTHSFTQRDILNRAGRTLLSQFQDEGSSSNDSPFAIAKNAAKPASRTLEAAGSTRKLKIDIQAAAGSNSPQAEESKKEAIAPQPEKVQSSSRPRIDIFSTAIASADINLDSFEYLEESIMSTEEMFHLGERRSHDGQTEAETGHSADSGKAPSLDLQLNQLLAESNITSAREKSISSNFA